MPYTGSERFYGFLRGILRKMFQIDNYWAQLFFVTLRLSFIIRRRSRKKNWRSNIFQLFLGFAETAHQISLQNRIFFFFWAVKILFLFATKFSPMLDTLKFFHKHTFNVLTRPSPPKKTPHFAHSELQHFSRG